MALIMCTSSVQFSPPLAVDEGFRRQHSRVLVRSVGGGDSVILSQESVEIDGLSCVNDGGKNSGKNVVKELKPLWDDGYGTQTVKDYTEISMDLIKCDGGPPRWFCPVACGLPLNDSPVLLYLPGIDGTGAGLVLHEKALGKVFHVQCFHIPVWDRTPLEGLIEIVEETVMIENASSPNKPIYLLGDSFGGSLALAVAARNPTIDLVLILANPTTSYEKSLMQPLLSLVRTLPEEHYGMFPYFTKLLLGDFVKMATIEINNTNHSWKSFGNIADDAPLLSLLGIILNKDTLTWRLELVESAAAYANSRLHAITAEVLVLASGKDNLVPSKNEAQRLLRLLKRCDVRSFEENGHAMLLESGVNVLTAIKVAHMYRHSSKYDFFKDFMPPSLTEFKSLPMETWLYRIYMGAAMFSTMEDGKIVRGLAGVPNEGAVLAVGNHMLWGFDVFSLTLEFLREKKILLHGLAHPEVYHYKVKDKCDLETSDYNFKEEYFMVPYTDLMKLYGAIPVTGRNLFRLLSRKSFVLLYPGGAREALHRKGEGCKLFWPDKQEFVRMAVKLGATIIPFGAIGEDDMSEVRTRSYGLCRAWDSKPGFHHAKKAQLIVDYNEMKRIPFLDQMLNEYNKGRKNIRAAMSGDIAEQTIHFPFLFPKIPGRLYYFFGKPIQTKGKENMLDDEDYLQELYIQIKCDVEKCVAYLLEKREEDPYRGVVERVMWQTNSGDLDHIPSFIP
ncbi:hypothetical protein OSB04_029705 [Centaurea solstitialis]|uniref:Serine aminopeptidase S33 domain-containing protein n=1 Tax=Centaurea solstitialis TaxID=347529 RepID=A0AA38VW15_9ASTR|nr:hypothetical protein OSB04_029705 [Centaurea solstitialis]